MDGYNTLIRRAQALSKHSNLSEHARNVLDELLAYHDDETMARETAESYLAAAERHVETYKVLEHEAGERGLPVARLDAWPTWREAAEILAAIGKAVLSNDERYGAYFDAMTIGKSRAQLTVEQLRNRLRASRVEAMAPRPEAREPKQRTETTPQQQEGFAHILDDPQKLSELREKADKRDRRLGRHKRRSHAISM